MVGEMFQIDIVATLIRNVFKMFNFSKYDK